MAGTPPSNRIGRSARLGGLVAGQSARWAGTRAANRLRSPEDAEAATGERAAALARELVKQLGQMRGAAMKVGQVLSTVDFSAIPESEREDFKATLAALRDDVPPLPFKKVRKLLEEELGGKVSDSFAEFDEEAFAAASIGQVHRAVTLDGDEVAVKLQYPGVAEAVESDLRNLSLLLPLVKRLAPGLDVKALYGELKERIAEELDYEIEAQNHRAVARGFRDHPLFHVPKVHTDLSSRRVLVTDLLHGKRFEAVKALDEAERDRFGEIVFRFYFTLLTQLNRVCGDPHPGNYLLLDDGRVGFLDFGLMRTLDPWYLEGERALARAVVAEDAAEVHAILSRLGYLPEPAAFDPEALLEWLRAAGEWYLEPGFRRLSPQYVTELLDSTSSPRAPWFEQLRQMTIPPQALLIRRMEGLVFSTLGELRAGADWRALAEEFFAERPAAL
jgi:predicted unusual protein kinase regulating ubiquinone biosynthesis (AarF/ABC1/UbiB family)